MEFFRGANRQKYIKILFLLIIDVFLINLASFLALFVRFEMVYQTAKESGFLDHVAAFAPLHTVMTVAILALFGLYNSLWAYVGMKELLHIVLASVISGVLQYFFLTMLGLSVPRSFPILNIIFLVLLLTIERFSYRILRMTVRHGTLYGKRVNTMLIGAGQAGMITIQELENSSMSHNRVVCIIDDDPAKQGLRLMGIHIVGGRDKIIEAVRKYSIKEIILAIPSCSNGERRRILEICQKTGCVTRTLPGLAELANGTVTVQKIRNVSIEDLLGRDSVNVDMEGIGENIRGRTVLVTGGGGSIGSELCRQVAACAPRRLIIFDIYENNAYQIQQELRARYPGLALEVMIGSVRDEARVEDLFGRFRPDIVYHAAAHKHVPLMEDSPNEAVKNNIFGTYNVAAAADKYRTETFVLISTDKAVNPTNVMGATKRVCEMIIQMFSGRSEHTRFVAVRFGNVLGSNGSVIPLFRTQIEKGGPVTVTHKDIIRYFMTVPEAVSLVMQAGVYAHGGEIFVLDMGDPVKIDDLARNMIRLSGFEPDVDIKIEYTGLRPGEKLYEELLMNEEGLTKTANNLIFVGHPSGVSDNELVYSLDRLKQLSAENSPYIREELARVVKTYHREGQPLAAGV